MFFIAIYLFKIYKRLYLEEYIIEKARELIFVSAKLTLRERMIYNYCINLIRTTKTDLEGYYNTTIKNISTTLKIKDYKSIKKILEKLKDTPLKINILKEEQIFTSLISEVKISEDNKVKIYFTPTLKEIALCKTNYAQINLNELIKVKSKNSIVILELKRAYTHKNNKYLSIPHLPLETFKSLMGFENKYISKAHIQRDILEKSQIDLAKNLSIILKYRFLKKGGIDMIELKINSGYDAPPEYEWFCGVAV